MKKIKLFALAAFAMLSTNAFAQSDGTSATNVFTFDHHADGTATITGFVSGLDDELKAGVVIPEFVTHPTEMDGAAKRKYQVTEIGAGAFADEPVQTIAFTAAVEEDDYPGIKNIGEGAFAGTKIQTLDLSSTYITYVRNFFGTNRAAAKKDDVLNATLKKVILPATATQIKSFAFWGCTKLESIDMTAATELASINQAALAGCPLKALDLSKNKKVTKLSACVLNDAYDADARFTAPTELVTVKLHEAFTALNGNLAGATKLTTVSGHVLVKPNKTEVTVFTLGANEFKGCTALTTIDTHKITDFNASCFEGCSSLASLDISAATLIDVKAFAGTALTSVTIPANAGLNTIGASAFFECASLATITLATNAVTKQTPITNIDANAFGYTAIEAFTLPAANTAGFTIAAKAFVGCSSLTDFTYAPEAIAAAGDAAKIDIDAFNRCSNVKFHTTLAFVTDWQTNGPAATHAEGKANANGPSNTKFDYEVNDGKTKFTLTPYKSNANKYYVKWSGKVNGVNKSIKVKKSDAKVYSAYVDATDFSLNLTQYAADNGYVYIKEGDVALIITENAELTYEAGTDGKTTSWQTTPAVAHTAAPTTGQTANALRYVAAATTRATLESGVGEGWYIYGWVNKSDACGFQKIASGTTISEGVLFAWSKPAASGRLTINWYDENGNLEAETTAIDGVKAAAQAEGARYNVAGQKVSAAYKGLVIKDGKKYMQK